MEDLLKDWGYLILFWYSFGGGMLGLAFAGVLSFTGDLNIYITISVAIIANILGDQFLFHIARNNKEEAKKMMGKHQKYVIKTEHLMMKIGSFSIIVQKYLYGIKTLIPVIIGLTQYDTKKFLLFNIIGGILWGVIVGGLSYTFGNVLVEFIEDTKVYAITIALIIIFVLFNIVKKVKSIQ